MPRNHVVQDGECLSSIALLYGFRVETIWDDPANEKLRGERNPYALEPGDTLVVPDLRVHNEARGTGKVHRFRRIGVPEKFHATFSQDGKPRVEVPFELTIGEQQVTGKTNDKGAIEAWMANDAPSGTLVLRPVGEAAEIYSLTFGTIAPAMIDDGVRNRLANLGIAAKTLPDAIRRFQSANGLPLTGEANDATHEALLQVYEG